MRRAEVHGRCDERFEAVRGAFAENFAQRGELGASVAVVIEGEVVVDLWGGWADEARGRAWDKDTLVNVFSVGKAMVALCVLMLVDRGEVALDRPVARYWPEFAAAGKAEITVRQVLSHQAGLPAVHPLLPADAMYDWELMTGALAAQEPWWEPGAAHGYHVNTFGFLAGEIVRRVSGGTVDAFFQREVGRPLGVDFRWGLSADDEARTADYLFTDETTAPSEEARAHLDAAGERHRLMVDRAYGNPPGVSGIGGVVNTPAWRRAEMPSGNAHATAAAVARIYGVLASRGAADGMTLVSAGTLTDATAEASAGLDLVLGRPSRFGLGFQLTQPERPLGPNPGAFGHFGVGGSAGFADPDVRLGFAYTMNRGGPRWRSPRNRALIDALYEAL